MFHNKPLYLTDVMALLEETTVVGNIEQWCRTYLDTGRHAQDWEVRLAAQTAQYAQWRQTGSFGDTDAIP